MISLRSQVFKARYNRHSPSPDAVRPETKRRPISRLFPLGVILGVLLTSIPSRALQISLQPLDAAVDPANIVLGVGETIRLAVEVDDVPSPGLAAFQFEILFDPAVVNLSNPNEAFRGTIDPFAPLGSNPLCTIVRGTGACEDPDWFLTSTGRSPTGTDEIDNTLGRILVAYGTSGSQSLPTGSGALALVNVTGVGIGTTNLTLSGVILADDGEPPKEYSATSVGAHVTVVPEPSTVVSLLAIGAVVGLIVCRRRL